MQGSEVRFYADKHDWVELCEGLRDIGGLTYTQTLSATNQSLLRFCDPKLLINHLRTRHPQASSVFLIFDSDSEPNSQKIVMADGSGVKLKVDQAYNPDAVLIKLGGQIDSNILIASSLNTTGETIRAREVFKLLKHEIAARAHRVGEFYVFRGALEKLAEGWRLTPDPGFSRELDLRSFQARE